MKTLLRPALLFIAIGLALYAALYTASEALLVQQGRSHPLFKIAQLREPAVDWVVLGASHAMPLDFGDFNAGLERASGQRIVQLAGPGTGPLYNRFVLEHFLRAHRARNLLYTVDSFAFYSRTWNEERFADAKLLRRTPFDPAIARRLWDYALHEGVDARAVLDYVSGFSKINNRERFLRDVWEGEAQFERAYQPSATAVKKRIDYLFPDKTSPTALSRYLDELASLIALAQKEGVNVVVIKMPVPPRFFSQLPEEAGFDDAISSFLAARGVPLHDFSAKTSEPSLYFDTDHLNRAGVTEFFVRDLKPVLVSGSAA